jgi:hypothetical protein
MKRRNNRKERAKEQIFPVFSCVVKEDALFFIGYSSQVNINNVSTIERFDLPLSRKVNQLYIYKAKSLRRSY